MTAFQIDANLAFDSYSELITTINDWLDRNDLTGAAPQMIALAEDEIRLTVEPLFLETSTSLVTAETTGLATLPSDVKRVQRVLYNNCTVPQRGLNAIDRMSTDTSQPHAFTIEQGAIRVWPAGVHTVQVLYQPHMQRLSNAAPTNNLLDLFPSLYFYGSLVFANEYVADTDRAGIFRRMFDMQLAKVADYYRKQRQSGQMVARVSFVP